MSSKKSRALSKEEYGLARWMLEHGGSEAQSYLSLLEVAEATAWKCPCGCASFNFSIKDRAESPPEVHILSEFVFGDGCHLSGGKFGTRMNSRPS